MKQLQAVSTRCLPSRGLDCYTEGPFQDHKTLKKGFNRLHEKHAESTTKVTALQQDLDSCRNDCRQLRVQVERSGAQVIAANNANSALRKVRIFHPHHAWTFY